MADVLVVGSYNQDHVWRIDRFLHAGETRAAHGFTIGPGGKGFNQAVACCRQGAATLFIGAVGDDPLATTARRTAEAEGLACEWHVCTDAATGACSILVDAAGQNQIAVALGANERLPPDVLERHRERFARAKLVLCQLETNLDAVARALALGRAAGALCVLNPAPVHADVDAALLAGCDLLTPNETELALLLERLHGHAIDAARVAALSDDALHAYCRRLAVPTVVVTLGARGCFVSHGDGAALGRGEPARYRVAAEAARPVDTTGAGDAFNGALAAALVRLAGAPFRTAVEHANRAAALSTEAHGAAPSMPHLADVHARFG